MGFYDDLARLIAIDVGESRARQVAGRLRECYSGKKIYFPKYIKPSTDQLRRYSTEDIQRVFQVSQATAYRYKKRKNP